MPTLDYLTGFNHRTLLGGLVGTQTGTVTIDTATVRHTGGSSLKITGTAASTSCSLWQTAPPMSGTTVFVAVGYVNFSVLPTANQVVLGLNTTNGAAGIGFNQAAGQFCIFTRTPTPTESFLNAAGPTVVTGTWYRVEFRVNVAANPWVVDGQIATGDGAATALTQATVANTLDTVTSGTVSFGNTHAATTLTAFLTDFACSTLSVDYPLGPLGAYSYSPNAVGTHNLDATTSQFFFTDTAAPGTTAALTSSETTSYQNINDVPLGGNTAAVKVDALLTFNTISRIAASAQAGTGGGAFTRASGDLIVAFAYRNTSATAPTNTAFTSLATASTGGGSAHSANLMFRIATNTATDLTVFTNATDVVYLVYRNAQSPAAGDVLLSSQAAATTINYPALTVSDHTHSWLAAFAGASATGAITAPTNLTNEANVNASPSVGGHDSNAIRSTDWPSTNVTVSSQYSLTAVIEIKATFTTTQPTNTWYAEYQYADEATMTVPPLAVRAIAGHSLDTNPTSTVVANLYDSDQGTNTADVVNATTGLTSVAYGDATFALRPGSTGVWTLAALNGLRLRFGLTAAASGNPRLESTMLEAAFPASVAVGAANLLYQFDAIPFLPPAAPIGGN